ncbi:MAG: class I SAM-dependent methyltransferase [Euryarchaeota archaeon]|nr:class I SAM-dependent methyltransferase [Euryarchaeota archaeon]
MVRIPYLGYLRLAYDTCKNLSSDQLANILKIVVKDRVGIAFSAPSDMPIEDRLFLYSVVRAFKPYRALEIGVRWGGSALIITNAMEDNKAGTLVGIDPTPQIKSKKEAFYGRYTLLEKSSPEAIPEAADLLGGQLDLVLLDSIHIFEQVYTELKAVLPWMSEDGIILVHDAFHYGVHAAIQKTIKEHTDVADCGFVNRTPNVTASQWTPYGGLYMLKMNGKGSTYLKQVELTYKSRNVPVPQLGDDILNHDIWYCRAIKPCQRCSGYNTAQTDSDKK